MKIIAHRGNILGPNDKYENHPDYILDAVWAGYEVEVDVWWEEGRWSLGHDKPQHLIKGSFLTNDKLWCHAKNFEAFKLMLKSNVHCFWHQSDDYTITSQGFIWTYPGKKIGETSVIVKPEVNDFLLPSRAYGVCTNFAEKVKGLLGEDS
mgnify:FL=1